ncbi:MAG: hypothetical protein FWE90_08485 [Defluviitaleaceae bacterium]|nr:hypothetical protein [Defluviitaleaceae bacterium]
MDLREDSLNIGNLNANEIGNIFNTRLGDIMVVKTDGKEFLYIDVGSGADVGWTAGHRQYSVFPLGNEKS